MADILDVSKYVEAITPRLNAEGAIPVSFFDRLDQIFNKATNCSQQHFILFILKHSALLHQWLRATQGFNSGRRLMDLRKIKGLSQEDLAKLGAYFRFPPDASRNRRSGKYGCGELQSTRLLAFSLDDFVSKDFMLPGPGEEMPEVPSGRSDIRISVPNLQIDKFKNIYTLGLRARESPMLVRRFSISCSISLTSV